jgi:hypothetical protein
VCAYCAPDCSANVWELNSVELSQASAKIEVLGVGNST